MSSRNGRHGREDGPTEAELYYADPASAALEGEGGPQYTNNDEAFSSQSHQRRTEDGRVIKADGTIVHPQAEAFFAVCPWVRFIPVLGNAVEGFGPVFVLSLNACYFLLKGIADQIIGFTRQPMMVVRFGLSGERYQRLASLYSMGWAIKAFIAMLTDTFALLGYTKRWYMLISCIAGAAFAIGYGVLPANPSSGNPAAAFIFLTCLGKANVDILSEGHYSRLVRRNPVPGPSLVSCLWVFILLGTLVAAIIQGPLSDGGKVTVGIFISAALQLVSGVFFVFNWYGELPNRQERLQDQRDMKAALLKARVEAGMARTPSSDDCSDAREPVQKDLHPERDYDDEQRGDADLMGLEEETELGRIATLDAETEDEELPIKSCLCGIFEINEEVVTRNWKVVIYSIIMTCSVVSMACVTILGTTMDLLYASIALSVVCVISAFLSLPLVIAKANVFIYIFFVAYVQLPGATDSFYLADSTCLPGGPNFSYTFYNTVGAVIQNIGGIAGVTIFTYVFSNMRYQVTMVVSTTMQVIASVFDLIILERWNLYIGIPDHAMYICGDAIIYQLCYMLTYMPLVLLMSRLCPRGSESMIYALIAGFSNLGQSVSNSIGSILIELRFPFKTTPPCDFSNVRWLIIIGHLIAPLITIPLSFVLLPHARISDDIDVNGHVIVKPSKNKKRAGGGDGETVPS